MENKRQFLYVEKNCSSKGLRRAKTP